MIPRVLTVAAVVITVSSCVVAAGRRGEFLAELDRARVIAQQTIDVTRDLVVWSEFGDGGHTCEPSDLRAVFLVLDTPRGTDPVVMAAVMVLAEQTWDEWYGSVNRVEFDPGEILLYSEHGGFRLSLASKPSVSKISLQVQGSDCFDTSRY